MRKKLLLYFWSILHSEGFWSTTPFERMEKLYNCDHESYLDGWEKEKEFLKELL